MNQDIETRRIVGVAITTDNTAAMQDIGALWARAHQAGLLTGAPAYSVYFDYESDHEGRYRVLVGVESDAAPGPDQEAVVIPSGTYLTVADEGPVPETTQKLWGRAYGEFNARRSYSVDFERYEGSPDNSKVQLFLSC